MRARIHKAKIGKNCLAKQDYYVSNKLKQKKPFTSREEEIARHTRLVSIYRHSCIVIFVIIITNSMIKEIIGGFMGIK